jgi:octopine/nopaline transport system permease protein
MNAFDLIFGPGGWWFPLVAGAAMTVAIAGCGFLIGSVLGAGLAGARVSGAPWLDVPADAIVTALRGVPDLLVIYLFYFGGSQLLSAAGAMFGATGFVGMPAFLTGAVALGVVSAAYQSEVFRGALKAVPPGEIEAARAAGMDGFLLLRRIVAPQILRFALPGLGNVWQLILKESALISVIGLVELLRAAQVASGSTRQPFLFYSAALVLYLVITTVSGRAFAWTEQRTLRPYRVS